MRLKKQPHSIAWSSLIWMCGFLVVGLTVLGCVVQEGKEREEALWDVNSSMSKFEIVRLAGEPDEMQKPTLCKDSSNANEEVVYHFEGVLPIVNKRVPRVTRFFCLDAHGKIVDCCGWIVY